jgi:4-amino-4-deoxy-L-arabinose transferase-like glycosyltransferase
MPRTPTLAQRHFLLAAIIVAYLVIASLYALYTPAWQVPDEPAHYNYIRFIAETRRLPILQANDYDQAYLDAIKARHFPPDLSIDPIRYESYQPPLYYLLATPIYWLTGGMLLPLRIFSIIMGALLLLLTYAVARVVFPGRDALALGATAFVAFLPQHVAMMAGVNNDALAEAIIAAALLLLVRYVGTTDTGQKVRNRQLVILGVCIGLGLLTKGSAYILLPLVAVAVFWRWWQARRARGLPREKLAGSMAAVFAPALLLGLPLWVRNMALYGLGDFLGKRWHDTVVVNQPRTAEWLAQMGLPALLRAFVQTTFHSFWGQFGWMGVLMDERIYLVLGILSAAVGLGLITALPRVLRDDAFVFVALLSLSFLLTFALYIWYNLTFVQHQGRYLFPALVPISCAFAAGLSHALRPRLARILAVVALAASVISTLNGIGAGNLDKWQVTIFAAAGVALFLVSLLDSRGRRLAYALTFVALAGLDLFALFAFIGPQLG